MPVSCGRRLSAPPTQLNALPSGIKNVAADNAWGFLWSAAGLTFTYASSDFRMKRLAVKKFMARYEPAMSPNEVVGRKVVDDIKDRLQSWRQKSDATIVGGRYKSGKTVAVQEALRGARGVWGFTVKVKNWEPVLPRAWREGLQHVS